MYLLLLLSRMKYWSCCQRKTSDFDNFLSQAGCTEGAHLWFKPTADSNGGGGGVEKVECRYDHHQTGGFVVLTVYAKNAVATRCSVRANRVRLSVELVFEHGAKAFEKQLDLYGVIEPLAPSVVNFFASKVEIKMKKADATTWPKLELPHANNNKKTTASN